MGLWGCGNLQSRAYYPGSLQWIQYIIHRRQPWPVQCGLDCRRRRIEHNSKFNMQAAYASRMLQPPSLHDSRQRPSTAMQATCLLAILEPPCPHAHPPKPSIHH